MYIPARRWVTLGSLLLALTLPACQPPRYNLTASFTAGRLFFDAEFPGSWPFKWGASQVGASYLEVVTSDQIIWAVQANHSRSCTTATQNPSYREPTYLSFPLAFGITPRCYSTVTPAKPLPEGTPILVRARGGVTEGSGQFEVRDHEIVAISNGEGVSITAPTHDPRWQAQISEAVRAGAARSPHKSDTNSSTERNRQPRALASP